MNKNNENIKKLTPLQKIITQEKGTEQPFSGKYNDFYEKGTYLCVCCEHILFNSNDKYNSHSGWPSFNTVANHSSVAYYEDNSLDHKRIEVCCANCDSHLGHVFNDGPSPTYKRYCINSASLQFKPDKHKESINSSD